MPKKINIAINQKLLEEKVPFLKYFYISLLVNLVFVFILLGIRRFLPPLVPLFYGNAEGEGQLAASWELIIPNLSAIAISLINMVLCVFIKDNFVKKTLILASIGIGFLAIITVIKIIFLVGSFNV